MFIIVFRTSKYRPYSLHLVIDLSSTMGTNKNLPIKGIKSLFYTIILMFTAPVVLFQAFKNQEHPWFWPVLILGLILAIAAVSLGFYSIKLFVDALFNKKVQDN